jgi:hypothetical protein
MSDHDRFTPDSGREIVVCPKLDGLVEHPGPTGIADLSPYKYGAEFFDNLMQFNRILPAGKTKSPDGVAGGQY